MYHSEHFLSISPPLPPCGVGVTWSGHESHGINQSLHFNGSPAGNALGTMNRMYTLALHQNVGYSPPLSSYVDRTNEIRPFHGYAAANSLGTNRTMTQMNTQAFHQNTSYIKSSPGPLIPASCNPEYSLDAPRSWNGTRALYGQEKHMLVRPSTPTGPMQSISRPGTKRRFNFVPTSSKPTANPWQGIGPDADDELELQKINDICQIMLKPCTKRRRRQPELCDMDDDMRRFVRFAQSRLALATFSVNQLISEFVKVHSNVSEIKIQGWFRHNYLSKERIQELVDETMLTYDGVQGIRRSQRPERTATANFENFVRQAIPFIQDNPEITEQKLIDDFIQKNVKEKKPIAPIFPFLSQNRITLKHLVAASKRLKPSNSIIRGRCCTANVNAPPLQASAATKNPVLSLVDSAIEADDCQSDVHEGPTATSTYQIDTLVASKTGERGDKSNILSNVTGDASLCHGGAASGISCTLIAAEKSIGAAHVQLSAAADHEALVTVKNRGFNGVTPTIKRRSEVLSQSSAESETNDSESGVHEDPDNQSDSLLASMTAEGAAKSNISNNETSDASIFDAGAESRTDSMAAVFAIDSPYVPSSAAEPAALMTTAAAEEISDATLKVNLSDDLSKSAHSTDANEVPAVVYNVPSSYCQPPPDTVWPRADGYVFTLQSFAEHADHDSLSSSDESDADADFFFAHAAHKMQGQPEAGQKCFCPDKQGMERIGKVLKGRGTDKVLVKFNGLKTPQVVSKKYILSADQVFCALDIYIRMSFTLSEFAFSYVEIL